MSIFLVGLLGCVRSPAPLGDADCPCVTGFFCCAQSQRCVAEGSGDCVDLGALTDGAVDADLQDQGVVIETDLALGPDIFVPPSPPFVDRTTELGTTFISLSPSGVGITVADFNGDGLLDLYFTLTTSTDLDDQSLFSGGPDFSFSGDTNPSWPDRLTVHEAMVPGDFDGDGRVDAVVVYRNTIALPTTPGLALLLGRADGSLGAPLPIELAEVDDRQGQNLNVTAVDLDGDGDLDLLGCRRLGTIEDARALLVYVENQAGVLREVALPLVEDPAAAQIRCNDLALADYDADGDLDLALCSTSIRLYNNDGGTWRDVTEVSGVSGFFEGNGQINPACHSIDWVDVDFDGRLDLAWSSVGRASPIRNGIMVLRQNEGRFARLQIDVPLLAQDVDCPDARSDPSIPIGYSAAIWVDVDLDGDRDLVLPSPFPEAQCTRPPYLLRSHFAQGEARLTTEIIELAPALGILQVEVAQGSVAADFDLDGDIDIASHTWSYSRRLVLQNTYIEDHPEARAHFIWVAPITDPDGDASDDTPEDDFLAPKLRVEVDLDGPAEAPDFAPGPGALAVRDATDGPLSHTPSLVHFGLGERTPPLWVRVFFADGSVAVRRVDSLDERVEVRDCAELRCGDQR